MNSLKTKLFGAFYGKYWQSFATQSADPTMAPMHFEDVPYMIGKLTLDVTTDVNYQCWIIILTCIVSHQ